MQSSYTLYKIKPKKLAKWRAWCHAINTRYRKTALATLHEENTNLEFFTIFKIGRSWYSLGAQFGSDIRPASKDRKLNNQHRAIKKECLEFVSKDHFAYLLTKKR